MPGIQQWTNLSGVAMAIFFTLSGYVIALSYSHWDWRDRPIFNLVRLFFYRFARLYPAFFIFSVLVILRTPSIRDLSDPAVRNYLIPHFMLTYTWSRVPLHDVVILPPEDPFHLAWSLSVECGLYLAFGLGAVIAMALPKWRYKALALGIVFFCSTPILLTLVYSARQQLGPEWPDGHWLHWLYFYSPYGVALQFGLGVVAYRISSQRFLSAALASNAGGAALIVISFLCVFTEAIPNPWHQWMLASVATALVMIGSSAASLTNRVLSGRAIVYVGTISYSLYLFHFLAPGMGFSGIIAIVDSRVVPYMIVNFTTALAMAIILSTGMYMLVEAPGRRFFRAMADRLLGIQSQTAAVAG